MIAGGWFESALRGIIEQLPRLQRLGLKPGSYWKVIVENPDSKLLFEQGLKFGASAIGRS